MVEGRTYLFSGNEVMDEAEAGVDAPTMRSRAEGDIQQPGYNETARG